MGKEKTSQLLKELLCSCVVLMLTGTVGFATESPPVNEITIQGNVPSVVSISTTDPTEVDFPNLGSAMIPFTEVGQITINSNSPTGFQLGMKAAHGDQLTLDGLSPLFSSHGIGYELALAYEGGVLGHTEPTEIANIVLTSSPSYFQWTAPTEPAVGLVYAVQVAVPTTKSLMSGSYSATLQFDIESI